MEGLAARAHKPKSAQPPIASVVTRHTGTELEGGKRKGGLYMCWKGEM